MKKNASRAAAGTSPMPNVVMVGRQAEPESDYSDAEAESEVVKPMRIDSKTTAAIRQQVNASKRVLKPTSANSAVLYLAHIPHGFYEEQMKGFFSQFGTVSKLRLARNKKTGRSKHYAFIEFKHKEVAEIVASAMNGYLMFSRVLVAKVLPDTELHPQMFKNSHRAFRVIDRTAVVRKNFNKPKTAQQATKRESQLLKGEKRKRSKLEALGIEYEFEGYVASAAAQPASTRKRGVAAPCSSMEPSIDSVEAAPFSELVTGEAAETLKVRPEMLSAPRTHAQFGRAKRQKAATTK